MITQKQFEASFPEYAFVADEFINHPYWSKAANKLLRKTRLGERGDVHYKYGDELLSVHFNVGEAEEFVEGKYVPIRTAQVWEYRPEDDGIPLESVPEERPGPFDAQAPKDGGKKYDAGKPAARLIPTHTLVPGMAEEFCYRVFMQDFETAIQLFPVVFGMDIVEAAQDALDYGLDKYKEEGSWASVPDGYNRYRDALSRHILEDLVHGEEKDPESKLPHNRHIAANCLFLRHFQMRDGHSDG